MPADLAPVLTLRKRTSAEVRAWHEGARLALTWMLGRLPGVVRHPPDATVPAADVLDAARSITEAIQASEEVIAAASAEHVEKARQHIYDLAAGRARFSMSIPPRASEDSDFVLLAACEAADCRREERDALARTVVALSEERDRLTRILACERGEWAPEPWQRNDIDPKREGLAWYRRWEVDGSEPGDEDTERTRVAWVRHDPDVSMIKWCWEIEAPARGVLGNRIAHGEGYDLAYESIVACDEYAAIEAADAAAREVSGG